MSTINLAIVGVGKIVRDQHLHAITVNPDFALQATASPNESLENITAYRDIETMLGAEPGIDAVALCMPPQFRYQAALAALRAGKHVLLEKPPGSTVSEVFHLAALAEQQQVSLYATWHSRCAAAVDVARDVLRDLEWHSVHLQWKEDVHKWHPGQGWIWQPGGLGVFDTGINGLSILTHLLSTPAYVSEAELVFPQNRAAPIAAQLTMSNASGLPIQVELDWRQRGDELWRLDIETSAGRLRLDDGGTRLSLGGQAIEVAERNEYVTIYQRFAELVKNAKSDADLTPLQLTADAFLLADRTITDPFIG